MKNEMSRTPLSCERNALTLALKLSAEAFVERTIDRDDPCVEWTIDQLFSLETPPNAAYLSADALQWPLRLRRWQAGDWFIPLGMSGQKKVSDALVDLKVSLPDKEQQGVLVSGPDTIV